MHRCDECGKFRMWDDLYPQFTGSQIFIDSDSWLICSDCIILEQIDHETVKLMANAKLESVLIN